MKNSNLVYCAKNQDIDIQLFQVDGIGLPLVPYKKTP